MRSSVVAAVLSVWSAGVMAASPVAAALDLSGFECVMPAGVVERPALDRISARDDAGAQALRERIELERRASGDPWFVSSVVVISREARLAAWKRTLDGDRQKLARWKRTEEVAGPGGVGVPLQSAVDRQRDSFAAACEAYVGILAGDKALAPKLAKLRKAKNKPWLDEERFRLPCDVQPGPNCS